MVNLSVSVTDEAISMVNVLLQLIEGNGFAGLVVTIEPTHTPPLSAMLTLADVVSHMVIPSATIFILSVLAVASFVRRVSRVIWPPTPLTLSIDFSVAAVVAPDSVAIAPLVTIELTVTGVQAATANLLTSDLVDLAAPVELGNMLVLKNILKAPLAYAI